MCRPTPRRMRAVTQTSDLWIVLIYKTVVSVARNVLYYVCCLRYFSPVYFVIEKQKRFRFLDTKGNQLYRPTFWERLCDIFRSETKSKQKLLEWVHSKTENVEVVDFTYSWQDGITLCALVEALCPGSCPQLSSLKAHHRVNNCRFGLKLARSHLHIPLSVISAEEMAIADKGSEEKIYRLVHMIKWAWRARSELSGDEALIGLKMSLEEIKNSCCLLGDELAASSVGKVSQMTIFTNLLSFTDLQVEIRGPRSWIGSEKMARASSEISGGVSQEKRDASRRSKNAEVANESRCFSCEINSDLETDWESLESIQFDYHHLKAGKFAITFVPRRSGEHFVIVRWKDFHVKDSPLRFHVSEPPSQAKKWKMSFSYAAKFSQFLITKRRVIKRIIKKNDEQLMVEEAPPCLPRSQNIAEVVSSVDGDEQHAGSGSGGIKSIHPQMVLSESPEDQECSRRNTTDAYLTMDKNPGPRDFSCSINYRRKEFHNSSTKKILLDIVAEKGFEASQQEFFSQGSQLLPKSAGKSQISYKEYPCEEPDVQTETKERESIHSRDISRVPSSEEDSLIREVKSKFGLMTLINAEKSKDVTDYQSSDLSFLKAANEEVGYTYQGSDTKDGFVNNSILIESYEALPASVVKDNLAKNLNDEIDDLCRNERLSSDFLENSKSDSVSFESHMDSDCEKLIKSESKDRSKLIAHRNSVGCCETIWERSKVLKSVSGSFLTESFNGKRMFPLRSIRSCPVLTTRCCGRHISGHTCNYLLQSTDKCHGNVKELKRSFRSPPTSDLLQNLINKNKKWLSTKICMSVPRATSDQWTQVSPEDILKETGWENVTLIIKQRKTVALHDTEMQCSGTFSTESDAQRSRHEPTVCSRTGTLDASLPERVCHSYRNRNTDRGVGDKKGETDNYIHKWLMETRPEVLSVKLIRQSTVETVDSGITNGSRPTSPIRKTRQKRGIRLKSASDFAGYSRSGSSKLSEKSGKAAVLSDLTNQRKRSSRKCLACMPKNCSFPERSKSRFRRMVLRKSGSQDFKCEYKKGRGLSPGKGCNIKTDERAGSCKSSLAMDQTTSRGVIFVHKEDDTGIGTLSDEDTDGMVRRQRTDEPSQRSSSNETRCGLGASRRDGKFLLDDGNAFRNVYMDSGRPQNTFTKQCVNVNDAGCSTSRCCEDLVENHDNEIISENDNTTGQSLYFADEDEIFTEFDILLKNVQAYDNKLSGQLQMVTYAIGPGLKTGYVNADNFFQVRTVSGRGPLTVGITGPRADTVLETSVVFTGDNAHDVVYRVSDPGYYTISVRWEDRCISESPFLAKVFPNYEERD